MFAFVEAVEAQDAFADSYIVGRFTATFAVLFAYFAIRALPAALTDSPDSPSVENTEKCAERTNESTIESRYIKIQQYYDEEKPKDKPGTLVKSRRYGYKVICPVGNGDNNQIERAGY